MPPTKSFIADLEHAVDGLLVVSETDAPLVPFLWPQPLPFSILVSLVVPLLV